MSKFFKVIVAVLIALSLATPSAFAHQGKGHDRGHGHDGHGHDSLVALGDSVSFGFNLGQDNNRPAKSAFPFLIGDKADLRVRNLSVPAIQTDDLLALLETNKKYRQAVRHADFVTVTIGGIDFIEILRAANAESGGDAKKFEALLAQKLASSDVFDNLADILKEIRSLTDAPVVLYNIYNPFQPKDPLHQIADRFLPQVNAFYADIADRFDDVEIADSYSAFGDNQAKFLLPNDVHPSKAGQKVLAKIGFKALFYKHAHH